MRPRRHDAPVAVVLGRRGSGKTTLVKSRLDLFPRVLICDPNHEYEGRAPDGLSGLYQLARSERKFRLVFRPPLGVAEAEELEAVDCLAEIAYRTGNLLLVVEEADRYTKHGKDTLPYLRLLIDQGRHNEIGVVMVARRPSRLPKDVIENASALYLFHIHEPHSQRYLAGIIGADVAQLAGLGAGDYLEWDERRGVRRRRIALGPPSSPSGRPSIAAPTGKASSENRKIDQKT